MEATIRPASPRTQVVLVVDDEPDILQSLATLLEDSIPDVRCVKANSGPQALLLMETTPVDLILTDYRMPGLDGLEFLRQARRIAPRTLRFLVTAYPDLGVALRAINEAGIEQFLTKPMAPDQVVRIVEDALLARRAREDRERAMARAVAIRKEA